MNYDNLISMLYDNVRLLKLVYLGERDILLIPVEYGRLISQIWF